MQKTLDSSVSSGWNLVSTNSEGTAQPTGVVHHANGCSMDNGRNKLVSIPVEQATWMKHCQRCEARMGNRPSVARPYEGKKVEVRLNDNLLSQVDTHAGKHSLSRAEALREIIATGLDHV